MSKLFRVLALMMAATLVVFMAECGYDENDEDDDYDENGDQDTREDDAEDHVVLFEEEGVVVVVPGREGEVEIKKLPLEDPERTILDEFTPARPVIDIAFVDIKGDILTTIIAELYVLYTDEDLENAGGDVQNLGLGFWDSKRWVLFTDDEHQFDLGNMGEWPPEFLDLPLRFPHDPQGFASVRISSWGDRAIAWGRPRF